MVLGGTQEKQLLSTINSTSAAIWLAALRYKRLFNLFTIGSELHILHKRLKHPSLLYTSSRSAWKASLHDTSFCQRCIYEKVRAWWSKAVEKSAPHHSRAFTATQTASRNVALVACGPSQLSRLSAASTDGCLNLGCLVDLHKAHGGCRRAALSAAAAATTVCCT
eukprot:4930241-Pleurochrysis_carterae.AAC.14